MMPSQASFTKHIVGNIPTQVSFTAVNPENYGLSLDAAIACHTLSKHNC